MPRTRLAGATLLATGLAVALPVAVTLPLATPDPAHAGNVPSRASGPRPARPVPPATRRYQTLDAERSTPTAADWPSRRSRAVPSYRPGYMREGGYIPLGPNTTIRQLLRPLRPGTTGDHDVLEVKGLQTVQTVDGRKAVSRTFDLAVVDGLLKVYDHHTRRWRVGDLASGTWTMEAYEPHTGLGLGFSSQLTSVYTRHLRLARTPEPSPDWREVTGPDAPAKAEQVARWVREAGSRTVRIVAEPTAFLGGSPAASLLGGSAATAVLDAGQAAANAVGAGPLPQPSWTVELDRNPDTRQGSGGRRDSSGKQDSDSERGSGGKRSPRTRKAPEGGSRGPGRTIGPAQPAQPAQPAEPAGAAASELYRSDFTLKLSGKQVLVRHEREYRDGSSRRWSVDVKLPLAELSDYLLGVGPWQRLFFRRS